MSKHILVASLLSLGGLASLGGCMGSADTQDESVGAASAAISTNTCSCWKHNQAWDGQPYVSTFLGSTTTTSGPTYGAAQWTVPSCKDFCRAQAVQEGLAMCGTYPIADVIETQGNASVLPRKNGGGTESWYENTPCPPQGGSSSGGSSGTSSGGSSSSSSSGGGGHHMECFPSYNACAAVCGGVCQHKITCGGPSAHKCFE
jgi:hypothetical protein